MRWLLFLSRLAFICGVFFVVALSLLINDWIKDPTTNSTIITIGYVMGIILLPVTLLCYMGVLITKRRIREYVPLWIILANILFFLLLIYFIFYLNDPYYHQK
jgi:drug/metabolite transporter (DMT)-like permease